MKTSISCGYAMKSTPIRENYHFMRYAMKGTPIRENYHFMRYAMKGTPIRENYHFMRYAMKVHKFVEITISCGMR